MSIRILVLEDNAHDLVMIERELRKGGLDVELRCVAGAEEFQRELLDHPPDVVLSEHNVPGYGGRSALALTRSIRPETPFILFTGSLDEESAVEYMKSGATDYLLKDRVARLSTAVTEGLERARERQALRRYDELLRQIIDANPHPIFVRDADGRNVLVNRALAAAYGTTVEQAVGKRYEDLGLDEDLVKEYRRADLEVLLSGEAVHTGERAHRKPETGEVRWFQEVKVPLRLPGEDRTMVLGVATDITERRRLEDQLRHVQKLDAVGRLAGGIAHDFNNILTIVLGRTELLLAGPIDAEAAHDLEDIRQASMRAAGLTNQLLAFARRQVLEPKKLDLNQLVKDLERMVSRLLGETLEVVLKLAPDLGTVHVDPSQLYQVCLNLAVNARDAMPNGGTLTIETGNVILDESFGRTHLGVAPGRYVVLTVSDTGVGMDEATQARLFEPFFTTKEAGKGTGLGLSTAYGIVKQSGGSIWAYSELGKGSSFRVYLPRVDPGEAEEPGPITGAPLDLAGDETILLVEDSAPVRALSVAILRGVGYHVLEAGNAAEAESIAASHPGPIDLLFSDIVMPGVPGHELARRLRKDHPDLRVLLASGYSDQAVSEGGGLTGQLAFLQKPFTVEGLRVRVRQILDQPPDRP